MSSPAVYNTIGSAYDSTRCADPAIISKLIQHLSPKKHLSYLDVGCGTGNYTKALSENGITMTGLDISEVMLRNARQKCNQIEWVLGDARALPFAGNCFNGATCVLATHHIKDIQAAFNEIYRVLDNGAFVLFTAFPEQMNCYWLQHYFPNMLQKSQEAMVNYDIIRTALHESGFQKIKAEPFFVTDELNDLFLYAGKYRPKLYLDASVRAGISTFALEENQDEIELGCLDLQRDIQSGKIRKVISSYESNLGDYAFVICNK